jgi:hypothetical protein
MHEIAFLYHATDQIGGRTFALCADARHNAPHTALRDAGLKALFCEVCFRAYACARRPPRLPADCTCATACQSVCSSHPARRSTRARRSAVCRGRRGTATREMRQGCWQPARTRTVDTCTRTCIATRITSSGASGPSALRRSTLARVPSSVRAMPATSSITTNAGAPTDSSSYRRTDLVI